MKQTLLATMALLAITTLGNAQILTERGSDQFSDLLAGRSYEADLFPQDNTNAPFVREAPIPTLILQESLSDGILTFQTQDAPNAILLYGVGKTLYREPKDTPKWWGENVDRTKGFTIEFRVRTLEATGYDFSISATYNDADANARPLSIGANSIKWNKEVINSTLVNHTDFHVYRLVSLPNSNIYMLWRDGVLISDSLVGDVLNNPNRFMFGDWSGQPGGGMLDYLRWDTSGAYAPVSVPEPSTVVALLLGTVATFTLHRRSRRIA